MGASGAPGRLRAVSSHVSYSGGSSTSTSTSSAAPAPPPPCREPQQYTARIEGDDTPGISSAEADAFKRQGFLLKHGLLGPDVLEPLRRLLWSRAPPTLRRDDRDTWVDPQLHWGPGTGQRGPDEAPERRADPWVGELADGPSWRFRSGGAGGIGSEPEFLRIANHPALVRCVAGLIGDPVRPCSRTRGVYCIFPSSVDTPSNSLGPHLDGSCNQISAMVLVEDAPPQCGGFTLWPGSHAVLWHDFLTSQGHEGVSLPPGNDDHTSPGAAPSPPESTAGGELRRTNRPVEMSERFRRHMLQIRTDVTPVEMAGRAVSETQLSSA